MRIDSSNYKVKLRRVRLIACAQCPLRTWELNILPEPGSEKFCNAKEVGPRGNDSMYSSMSNFYSQRGQILPKFHQVYKHDPVHPRFHDYTSRRLFLASAGRQIHAHAHAAIYTRQRKQIVAHKFGRQFFEVVVREIMASQQVDAEDRYSVDKRGISNFGKEFYELSFVRAEASVAQVQATL